MIKTYLLKPISLVIAVLFVCCNITACTRTGVTQSGGIISDNIIENDKNEDEIISEDEKYGRVTEDMLGAVGDKVDKYSGYLGYGYNTLTSAFYNHKDIKTSHPIVDMDSLVKQGSVYVNSKSSQHVDNATFVSNSAKEYSQHFAAAASVKAKFAFVGSFKASFKMDHTYQMNSNQNLITTQALLETQNEYILNVDANMLAAHATPTFKQDVDNKTAQELIDTYGTHVLANITLGGRFDINYFYTRTESSESTDIEASAQASYRNISGNISGKDSTDKNEIETHSKLLVKTYGGTVTVDSTSVDEAKKSYKEWSKGVEDGKITFVNASEVIPIWEIVAKLQDVDNAAEKSAQLKKYFDDNIDQLSGEFKDTVNSTIYISDVYVGYGSTSSEAKNMLRNEGVTEGHIVNLDLNTGVGGNWIYLGYKTTTNKSEAITGLVADYYKNPQSSNIKYKDYDYNIIPVDLNKGARGKYIYLYYTKDSNAGEPLTAIQYQHNDDFQYENIKADGFLAVRSVTDDKVLDLNKGSGGDFIYLWFKRSGK